MQIKHTIFFYEIKPIFVANHKKYFLLQKNLFLLQIKHTIFFYEIKPIFVQLKESIYYIARVAVLLETKQITIKHF